MIAMAGIGRSAGMIGGYGAGAHTAVRIYLSYGQDFLCKGQTSLLCLDTDLKISKEYANAQEDRALDRG